MPAKFRSFEDLLKPDPKYKNKTAIIDDWHTIGLTESADLTADWKPFTYTFTAEMPSKGKDRVSFILGNEKGKVWLKDVKLMEK